jgi:GH24 family phage-related lysozyme (muramidase)
MTLSQSPSGRAGLEREEGEVLHVYPDFADLDTAGVGHRLLPSDPWWAPAKAIRARGLSGPALRAALATITLTQDEVDALIENDVRLVEACVRSFTLDTIGQNMFDALCSLGFNIGTGAERASSVARMMRVGGYLKAADHFRDWNKAVIGGVLQVSEVLVARRERERTLFLLDVSTTDDA